LDDVTSALDSKVADQILSTTVRGYLREKTVVLVTNNMSCIPKSDQIYVMENGKIAQRGTFAEVQ